MEYQEFLRNVDLFAGIESRHLKSIAKGCTERIFATGDYIVKQGNPGVGLFIIVSGRVVVKKRKNDGAELTVAEHGPGEVIGEMAVLDGAPRTADVIAQEETTCLALPSWTFNSYLEGHPEVALHILPIVVRRFRETNEALMRLRDD